MEKRYAVLTGASRGIGKALAMSLAPMGWELAVCSRSAEKLAELEAAVQEWAPDAILHTMPTDMGIAAQVDAFGAFVQERMPRVDALVHNAGVFQMGALLEEVDGALESMMAVNVYSAYRLSRLLVPSMVQRGSGDVVFVCSVASQQAYPAGGSYGITKHALLGMARNLREELRENGVRVSAILPGATWTDSWSGVEDLNPERLMPAEDIAEAIHSILEMSPRTVVEEMVLRPQLGDL
jgi:short-subunit dehydrogenase